MSVDTTGDSRASRCCFFLLAAFCLGALLGAVSGETQAVLSGCPPLPRASVSVLLRRLCVRLALPGLMLFGCLLGLRRHVPFLFFVRGFCFCLCLPTARAWAGLVHALICLPILFQTGVSLLTDDGSTPFRLLLRNAAAELLAVCTELVIF